MVRKRALELLKEMFGQAAEFRPGQLEAIERVAADKRALE